MKKPTHFHCERCTDEIYGDDFLFDLCPEGLGWVCENCFLNYASKNNVCSKKDFEECGRNGRDIANKIGIYYTTVESYIENEYYLMLEEKEEARRDMYL